MKAERLGILQILLNFVIAIAMGQFAYNMFSKSNYVSGTIFSLVSLAALIISILSLVHKIRSADNSK